MLIESLLAKIGFDVDEKPLHSVEEKLEGISKKLEFLAAAEVVRGIYELAERFGEFGERLESAAVSAGLTTEAFQKLSFAAAQNAVSQEELSGALSRLNRRLYNAKEGSEEAIKSFASVGISQEQIKGFHTSSDALKAVSAAFSGIQDPVKKQALAMELFGRGSANMVKFLNQGPDSMDKFAESAESMGAVLSGERVESLAQLQDSFISLFQVIKVFMATIASDFAPAITEAVKSVEKFWAANHKIVELRIEEWAGDASYAFGFITEAVRLAVTMFMNFANAHPVLVRRVGEFVIALMGLSLTLTVFKSALGLLFAPLFGLMTTLKAVGASGVSAFELILSGAGLLKSGLGSLALRVAIMAETLFPALSAAALSLGASLQAMTSGGFLLWLGGIAVAVGAVVLVVQEIWALLHGKSFWDTWLGEGLQAILKYGGRAMGFVRGIFGHKESSDDATRASAADAGTTGDPALDVQRLSQQLDFSNLVAKGANGLGSLQDMAQQPGAGGAMDPGGQATMQPVAYNFSQTNTINVPAGTDPKAVAEAVRQGAQDATDRQVREAHRGLQVAAVR